MTGFNFPQYNYQYPARTGDSFERKTPVQPTFAGKKQDNQKELSKVKVEVEEIKDTFQSFTNAVNDVDKLTKPHKKEDATKTALTGAFSMVPGLRRISPIEDNAESNNKVKVAGLAAIALINAKEDIRDIYAVLGRVKSEAPAGYCSKFGFFTGTTLETWLKKSERGQRFIMSFDKTIGDLNVTQNFLKKVGVERTPGVYKKRILKFRFNNIKSFIHDKTQHPRFKTVVQRLKSKKGDESGIARAMDYIQRRCKKSLIRMETIKRNYVSYSGPKLGKLIGYTFDRMPLISLGIAALLELPTIVKAIKEKDDKKQIARSGISLGMSVTTGAFLSAAGAMAGSHVPVIGPALSVIGLGVGAFIGYRTAKEINSHI